MVEANQILEKSTENPLERVTVVYFVTKYCYLQTLKPNSIVVSWNWLSED